MVEDVDGDGSVEGVGQDGRAVASAWTTGGGLGGQYDPGGVQPDDPRSQRRRQRHAEGALPAADVQDPPCPDADRHLGEVGYRLGAVVRCWLVTLAASRNRSGLRS